jgi:Organic Anion Transporter Polypeptide (OATP) family
LLFTAAGILVSATVISKFQPSARKLAGWNVFTEVLDCAGFVAILFIKCGSNTLQDRNTPSFQEYASRRNLAKILS